MRIFVLVLILPILTACMPAAGPDASKIVALARSSSAPYDVITLDSATADWLASNEYESLASSFGTGGGVPDLRIGVGDTIVVTIFEAASGGLFSGEAGSLSGSKSVNLPPQLVARNGTITVPYVGEVRVQGLTPAQVQANIVAALRDKAIEPQVIVTVTDSNSTFVTVTGDVGNSGRVPLHLGGDRILDLIATAGGSRAPDYDSFVRLTRNNETVTVGLARIVNDPAQNIYVRPEDQIFVFVDPQRYTAFGATGNNTTLPFETDKLTLASAVGRAGGLDDNRADPSGVFVFRFERPELYAQMRRGSATPKIENGGVPVIYQVDLNNPTGFFALQRFLMRDNDVVYVSNAGATDLAKFIDILGSGMGVARSGVGLQNSLN